MSVAGIKSGPARDPLLGARIDGRYRIRAVHGRGGMGVVYSAVHEDLRRDVAVKVLDKSWASDRTAIERFLQEARTASGLSHGNIVDVLDLGRLPDGRPYLVMPLIVGSDLATVLAEEGPQHPKRVASLLSGVASGLDLIHAKGLVHHDIKPENLMQVRREDGSETVLVLDFGIAGARFPADGRGMELFDRGTPEFMPPEAASGVVPDRRGDIYALATVAFELMTGRLPFDSADDAELATLKATRPPSSMTYASGLSFPLALEAVVARGLATRPAERYATAGEFVRRLAHVAAQIADDFLTHQRAVGSSGPMLQPPANRPQRRAVTSRSRTLMTAGGLARVSTAAAETAVPATPETAPTEAAAPAAESVFQPAPAQPPTAAVASVAVDANNTSQTQPQMHAVSVPPVAPGDRAQAFAEASAEASGARVLPREGDPRASEAPAPAASESPSPQGRASVAPRPAHRTSTITSAHGPLAPVRHPERSSATPTLTPAVMAATEALYPSRPSPLPIPAAELTGPNSGADRVDPLAPTLTNMVAAGATSSGGSAAVAAAAEAGPATMLEWSPTEASGTFLREDPRDEPLAAGPQSSQEIGQEIGQESARPSLTQPHGSVSPASVRSAALRASSAPASGRYSGPPISAPPPAAGADPDEEAILVVDANDTSASPFPPPPDHPLPSEPSLVAPRVLAAADYDTDDDSDADEIDALYAMAEQDDRITDPPDEFQSRRRTVLLHPAMLTVYGCALLFWLYAVLPEQNPQAEELPAPSAAVPVAPYSPAPRPPVASAPVPSAAPAPALVLPSASAPPPAAEAIAPREPVSAPAADAPRAHRSRARQARDVQPAVRSPRATEQADDAPAAFARQPIAPPPREGRSAAELTREAEDAILRGDSAGAAQLYDRAIAADSSYAPAFRGKGLVMERLGKPDKAADAFRTFLRLSPGSASAAKVRERLEALDAQ